ncbi:hypothetical protein [Persicobacter psychrovividus]|uniref:Uncharacterized protein n=1 Tax=Persicobacter psychrovividus TaxID=387638 RepID=A0ABM7VAA9_9BACT|nr:hypothetical protein PEPS_01360 [Persicobacter psychrovividus]
MLKILLNTFVGGSSLLSQAMKPTLIKGSFPEVGIKKMPQEYDLEASRLMKKLVLFVIFQLSYWSHLSYSSINITLRFDE